MKKRLVALFLFLLTPVGLVYSGPTDQNSFRDDFGQTLALAAVSGARLPLLYMIAASYVRSLIAGTGPYKVVGWCSACCLAQKGVERLEVGLSRLDKTNAHGVGLSLGGLATLNLSYGDLHHSWGKS